MSPRLVSTAPRPFSPRDRATRDYPDIAEARLFGSRAKGNYKVGSDIDIAVRFRRKDSVRRATLLNELHDRLEEELPLPYFFDLVDYNAINNSALKEHIDRVGIIMFKNTV